MKKTYTPKELNQKQGKELSKKLYRSISEYAKCLDDARTCARSIGDLFLPNLQIQRTKLRDYCERLIFSEPALYGRKTEELLWRKCYYDVITQSKKLKRPEGYQPAEIATVEAHLNAGVGFYFHILSKLQLEFHLHINHTADFALTVEEKPKEKLSYSQEDEKWANHAVHQSLIYLGDLSRYKLEFHPTVDPSIASRYYLQAISLKPDIGMPHNQMGTLASTRNHLLDAVFHYMRCLACKQPFDGTKNNLRSLFEKNSKLAEQLTDGDEKSGDLERTENIKRFLVRFLQLIDTWYFDKKMSKVFNWCHAAFVDLERCLSYLKATDELPTTDSGLPSHLSNAILFKIVVICLMTIAKLRASNSMHVSTVVAFTLAIYSQLLRNIANRIQEAVVNHPLCEEEEEDVEKPNGILKQYMSSCKKKMRRRKKAVKIDSEESDLSETELDVDYASSDDSFISSDEEDVLADSSEDEDEKKVCEEVEEELAQNGHDTTPSNSPKITDVKLEAQIIKKVQRMDVNDMLEIITDETALQCIKVLNDWLKYDTDVLKSCGKNTRNLMHQITYLLNLINVNLSDAQISGVNVKISEVLSKETRIPLCEDVQLKGLEILLDAHNELDWNYFNKRSFNRREESVVRIVKLISFGRFLTGIQETGVHFHDEKNVFVCDPINEDDGKLPAAVMEELNLQEDENGAREEANGDEDGKGGQLMKMKHMGQLWLAAEVRALESRVGGKPSLSPYLVLDADALIKYTFMVKHLVNSKKFIVLVPTAVVNVLDDLKREKIEARDAIRWLEAQFHRGNRFFRAQRQHERATLPFIKYPKKKDKEMFIYIQIIECCNFLAEQQKGASNLVTLLIGNHNVLSNGENREFSYVGLAQSAGIAIESITQFYGKWKKSKGKR